MTAPTTLSAWSGPCGSRAGFDARDMGTVWGWGMEQSVCAALARAFAAGWMTAHDYDQLAEDINGLPLDHEARRLFELVERRVDPPASHHLAMLDQADTDQLWTCRLTRPARDQGAAWVSSNAVAVIEAVSTLVLTHAAQPDRPHRHLRVVFDPEAIATTLEHSPCRWATRLARASRVAASFDVRIELVHGTDPPVHDKDIATVLDTLVQLRCRVRHSADQLTATQLHYARAVLECGRAHWPALVAAGAGAELLSRHEQLSREELDKELVT